MLEKPDVPDELIIARLQDDYGLGVAGLAFLSLGADLGTAVYRAVTRDGTAYFVKLRKGFEEITVAVPVFLESQGIQALIVPFQTKSKGYWADCGQYKLSLYPFIEGRDGFDRELSDQHRRSLGVALKGIHTAEVPPELGRLIPNESFAPQWRESVRSLQMQAENRTFTDETAAKLANFMRSKRDDITRLLHRTEQLASEFQSRPVELVLCHSDIHGGNILISQDEKLYIVDWDNPILAPKERDLMFIGGGIDDIWKSEREEAMFYEGYGKTELDLTALAYYRYERVIEDLAVIAEQLFLSREGGADRKRSYGWFTSNFEPGKTIAIACKTDKLSTNGL